MGMIKKSISYKLSIYISLAVISIFMLFIIITYVFNQQILRDNIEQRAIGLSMKVNSKVSKQLISTEEIATNLAHQALYYAQNDDAELLISGVMKRYQFLNAIHIDIDSTISLPNHNFYISRSQDSILYKAGENQIIDCEEEREVLAAVSEGKVGGWTEPFRCNSNENIIVSYYSPVTEVNNGDTIVIGEVICELSLLYLNEIINDLDFGNGYAFLIDRSGRYITHPIQEWILNKNVMNLSDKVTGNNKIDYENIFSNDLSGSTIAYPEILNYRKSWVYYAPIQSNDWYLIFVFPYNTLFAELYLVTLRLLLFAFVGILAIFFMVSYISNRLIRPLRNVTDQLNKFSSQTGAGATDAYNEINLVSESLKSLKLWYEKQKDEQNQALIKSNLQKQDLLQASEIQQSIIKTDFPAFPERKDIDVYAVYKPAREVSGDLFDFFFISDDDLVFTIGDVSGKGVPAAIFMSIAQTIIKSNALYKKAKNIVNKANKELCTNNQHQFFLTLFLGVLKVKKRELYFCNAAHTTALIVKEDKTIIELNQSHGLPLGLYPEKDYIDSKIPLEKGDTIVLYTDGITELQNKDKKQFGMKRFKELLKPLAGKPPYEMAKAIEAHLEKFKGEAPQYDDISLLIIKYKV